MHDWNDTLFDWIALDDACKYMEKQCRKYARLGIQTKEKWGVMRVDTTCAYFTEYDFIHHWFYPGHYFYRFPKWFRIYVDRPVGWIMGRLGVVRLLQWYQNKVLDYFWNKAAKKWSHISEEILNEKSTF